MKKVTSQRKVKVYKNQEGQPFISYKTRPNDKCYCGSGKKQKHCHGNKQVFEHKSTKSE